MVRSVACTVALLVLMSGVLPADAVRFRRPVDSGYLLNYFDHDDTSGLRDYKCGQQTYDNHKGIDWSVSRYQPIKAVAPGRIYYSEDGWPDGYWGSSDGLGRLGNQVRINHGERVYLYYGHMQAGSPSPSGIDVVCGQQVGQIGSSGWSSGPHLHLHFKLDDVTNTDPFAGPCSPTNPSYWVNQGTGDPSAICEGPPTPTNTPGPVADILIESRSGGRNYAWYSESGTWGDSGATCQAEGCTAGIGSRYGSTLRSTAGTKKARFAPELPQPGDYEVYAAWGNGANRQKPILHRVVHSAGTAEIDVDQTATVNQWVSLGTYRFVAGTGQYLEVSNEHIDISGAMYAAAAKFVYRGGLTPVPTFTPTPTVTTTATATSTLTRTPTRTATAVPIGDADRDGIPDAVESANPQGDQTNWLLPDSDGDGLWDSVEDANRNGVREADETSGRRADTDGDGLPDGVERLRAVPSDPLNPASPISYTDADRDGLPLPDDPNDGAPDSDGDRFGDAYEFVVISPLAVSIAAIYPSLGDPNGDGFVTNVDALVVQSLFLSLVGYEADVFHGEGFKWVDTNRDGFYTNVDALVIQSFFLTIIQLIPL